MIAQPMIADTSVGAVGGHRHDVLLVGDGVVGPGERVLRLRHAAVIQRQARCDRQPRGIRVANHPGDHHAVALAHVAHLGAGGEHDARRFVAEQLLLRPGPVHLVQLRVADAARELLDDDLVRPRDRAGRPPRCAAGRGPAGRRRRGREWACVASVLFVPPMVAARRGRAVGGVGGSCHRRGRRLGIGWARHHAVRMKTTLILDDDVAAFLREQAQLHDKSLRQVVNETLRRSMPPADGQPPSDGEPPRQPYRVPTFSSGYAPGIDPRDPKAFKNLPGPTRHRALP